MCNEFHEPNTVCQVCCLEVDEYGNTEEEITNCCFPDCGCDGNRNCMAKSGPNFASSALNLEKRMLPDGTFEYVQNTDEGQ